jgi:hypothetical protein
MVSVKHFAPFLWAVCAGHSIIWALFSNPSDPSAGKGDGGTSTLESHAASREIARMIVLVVIPTTAFNVISILLSGILNRDQAMGNQKALELLMRFSPVAWQHIHFLGHYTFRDKQHPIDLEAFHDGNGDTWDAGWALNGWGNGGTAIHPFSLNNGPDQQFNFLANGQIQSVANTSMYLADRGGILVLLDKIRTLTSLRLVLVAVAIPFSTLATAEIT